MRAPSLLGAILVAGALVSSTVAAQNQPHVDRVLVRDGAAIEVEIHTSGTIASPNTQAITGPDRIVVDFPGALPASGLRALKVGRGPLKGIRSGLFFNNPPVTRIVLDLTSAQEYRISPIPNGVVVSLGAGAAATNFAAATTPSVPKIGGAHLAMASRVATTPVSAAPPRSLPAVEAPASPEPPKPDVNVTFQGGMLRIHADRATLAEVLFEVQRQTQADIAIPAGAEQEKVWADLGPAPVRDVLASLLNGSSYNFIFVGNDQNGALGKVILSRREPAF